MRGNVPNAANRKRRLGLCPDRDGLFGTESQLAMRHTVILAEPHCWTSQQRHPCDCVGFEAT